MKKIFLVLVAVFFLICATTATAGPVIDRIMKNGELVVGTSAQYPPMTMETKDGKLIGLDMDIAGLIAAEMGVKAKIVKIPFDELLNNLAEGKIDMVLSNMTITPERNLKFAFVGPYFFSGQSVLTTDKISVTIQDFRSMDKPDFSVAVPAGTTSEMIAKNNLKKAKLVVTKNTQEGVSLLIGGKVQAVIADVPTCAVAVFRNLDKKLVATPAITFEPIGIAVAPDDPLLVNWLDNFLMSLKESGDLESIIKRWFKNDSWMKELP